MTSVWAQSGARLPTVGIAAPGSAEGAFEPGGAFERFVAALRDLGWVDGRNLRLLWRFDPPPGNRFPEHVAEFVAQRVDLIVAGHSGSAMAAKRLTSSIPVVMAVSADPVADGLVASLARPGGNLTGMSIMSPELTKRRLQLAMEVVPGTQRVAVVLDTNNTRWPSDLKDHEEAAQVLGLTLLPLKVSTIDELPQAFELARRQQAQVTVLMQSATFAMAQPRIAAQALAARMPTVAGSSDGQFVRVGGLMNFGANIASSWQGAATYVDRILKGAKPAELPIQQPSRFELSLNAKTAQALGLTLPPHLLLMAGDVIR